MRDSRLYREGRNFFILYGGEYGCGWGCGDGNRCGCGNGCGCGYGCGCGCGGAVTTKAATNAKTTSTTTTIATVTNTTTTTTTPFSPKQGSLTILSIEESLSILVIKQWSSILARQGKGEVRQRAREGKDKATARQDCRARLQCGTTDRTSSVTTIAISLFGKALLLQPSAADDYGLVQASHQRGLKCEALCYGRVSRHAWGLAKHGQTCCTHRIRPPRSMILAGLLTVSDSLAT